MPGLRQNNSKEITNTLWKVEGKNSYMYLLCICFVWSALQDQAVAFEDLKKTMETTRAHLQNQLRSKEMECGRLSVQIRVRISLI